MAAGAGEAVVGCFRSMLAAVGLRGQPGAVEVQGSTGGMPGKVGDEGGPAVSHDLNIEGISKYFGPVQALAGVTFTVKAGEFVTLLGPSGCGKTTLLRIIAGFERSDEGHVRLGERLLDDLPANRRPVNTVFQSYALFPHLSVYANIAFGLRARHFAAAEVDKRVEFGLGMLQLDGLAERYPHQLSGGQKQRVALARALVNEPEVLLLDEPMSALDAKLRAEVQIEMRRLQRKLGKTFILVTHDQDEAMTVSDRILVMNQGRIEQIGTSSEVYEKPRNRFVAEFLGAANLIPAELVGPRTVQTALGMLELRADPRWERGTLAIHPERIEARRTPPKSNGVRVRVKDAVYRGDHVELLVEPGPLRVQAVPGINFEIGERLWLELPAERLEVLLD
ncbi:MAG: ABC transporter ATP-binding protein [Phycisphaeraceae bacterium]|nr:ABC transporter ATP-binding protein [Phycisphaeraceae bacterium]